MVTNWKYFEVGKLFTHIYKASAYNSPDLTSSSAINKDAIRYITRTDTNNGCKEFVKNENFTQVEQGNAITIGDTTSTIYYQNEQFICGDHIVILRAPFLNEIRGIFIVALLNKERFRFNYGRSFKMDIIKKTKILLQSIDDNTPDWNIIEDIVKQNIIPALPSKSKDVLNGEYNKKPISSTTISLDSVKWNWFRFDEIFDIKNGFYNKKPEDSGLGTIAFIGATETNNGITSKHTLEEIDAASKTGENPNQDISEKIFTGNCITVSNNGSIGFAFYQEKEFTCSHDVNPLYLKGYTLNKHIAIFLCTLIEQEQYRWAYGRKWRPKRMPSSLIKLPIKTDGSPDWKFMENYIKSLPYSANI
jgi:hypothetical protein